MREILFRGKCKDSGKWYEGYYVHLCKTTYCFKEDYDRNPDNDMHRIIFEEMMDWGLPNQHFRGDVLPETIGQYTGSADKNGKKIFEGDIGRYKQTDGAKWNGKPIICTGKVIYNTKTASFAVDSIDEIGAKNYDYFPIKDFEVIGNIHDNPELLKSGAE